MPTSDPVLLELVRSAERVEARLIGVDEKLDDAVKRLNDHSKRLHGLERWRAAIAGAVGVITMGAGYILHQLKGGS